MGFQSGCESVDFIIDCGKDWDVAFRKVYITRSVAAHPERNLDCNDCQVAVRSHYASQVACGVAGGLALNLIKYMKLSANRQYKHKQVYYNALLIGQQNQKKSIGFFVFCLMIRYDRNNWFIYNCVYRSANY